MSGATTSTVDPVIRPEVREEISDAVFRNSDFIPLFRQEGPFGGGTYDLKVIVAANSSAEVFVEDGAVPDPGYQQTVTAQVPWKHFRVFTRLTGHARRELNAPSFESSLWPGAYGGLNFEESKAKEDLVDLVNTTFLGTSVSGVQGIIDSSTAFYNLSRSTYAALVSYEKAGSAALSLALMDRLIQETYNQPYGGRIQLLIMAPGQARKYASLVEGKIQVSGMADIAGARAGMLPPYAGAAAITVRDLDAGVILGLSNMDQWFFALHEAAPGGIDVQPMGMQADARVTQYVTSGALVCPFPNRQGKLTTLGTT